MSSNNSTILAKPEMLTFISGRGRRWRGNIFHKNIISYIIASLVGSKKNTSL